MKKRVIFLLFCSLIASVSQAQLRFERLRCNDRDNPLGVETARPALSWELLSDQRGQRQTAYRVLVSDDSNRLAHNEGTIWDSGKQDSDASIQVGYAGKPLLSQKLYYWKVQVWDKSGKPSAWSAPASWQMGLLTPADWRNARWIALTEIPDSGRVVPFVHVFDEPKLLTRPIARNPLPQFRKEIKLKKPLRRATAFVCGLGHFELYLNGQKVGNNFIDPGWTNYNQYALYVTHDITSSLKTGANVFGVLLGNGFYNVPNERYRKVAGTFGDPKLIAKIRLDYADGSSEDLVTDTSWRVTASPITYSSIYGGEDFDATRQQRGWQQAGFDDRAWQTPVLVQGPPQLLSQTAPPVKIMDTFSPARITQPKTGVWIVDLGQNASAIPQITVRGKAGSVVKITPGELLGADSLVSQESSGGPVFFRYTLAGESEPETWHPQFTYFGYRYLQIEGAAPDKVLLAKVGAGSAAPKSDLPLLTDVRSLHVRSSAETVGSFTSSNTLFNRTDRLIDWAIRSNLMSVMTDCPHREKLGWLEETHLMGSSVRYAYDIAPLLPKIIRDMRSAQLPNGMVPDIAPEYVEFVGGFRDSPEWGSASVILPWYTYQWYGDRQTLADSYAMMTKYVGYLTGKADNHLLTHGLGDWYDLGPKYPGESQLTPKGITATAVYYYDLTILQKTATLLGKPDDATRYGTLAAAVKQAFNAVYYDAKTGQYGTGSQTANAMPLYMGLTTPENHATVQQSLLTHLKETDYRLTAGDVGYRYLLRALEGAGASEVIYRMNNRADVPGYGYQLAEGATALTESWSALRNTSNNHFMLGHLSEWLYSGLGGIQQNEAVPAYKDLIIRPELVGNMASATVQYRSPYGLVRSEWQRTDTAITLTVEVPVNSTATIYLPSDKPERITESSTALTAHKQLTRLGIESGKTKVRAGSGVYTFRITR